jgi:carboxymethylenebutenolidase
MLPPHGPLPHHLLTCPLAGGKDAQFPPPTVDAFEAQLAAAGVPHHVLRFPGEGHAFVVDVESTRRPGAAAEAWAAFQAFLQQHLRP